MTRTISPARVETHSGGHTVNLLMYPVQILNFSITSMHLRNRSRTMPDRGPLARMVVVEGEYPDRTRVRAPIRFEATGALFRIRHG
jgi:hypothetical protein